MTTEPCTTCNLPIANWPNNDTSGCQCKSTPMGEHPDAFLERAAERLKAKESK